MRKLKALDRYLSAYTTALKFQRFRLMYVDAFAGSGDFAIKGAQGQRVQAGSARIALATEPRFDELIFIERNLKRMKTLAALAREFPERRIDVMHGDANRELLKVAAAHDWGKTRATVFLDPYGLSVEWATLQRIAKTEAVDVWYLFPLAGLYRQLAVDAAAIDEAKASAITSILGTDEWRREMYAPPAQAHLFDEFGDAPVRHADWRQIAAFVTRRLREVFPAVLEPHLLHLERRDGTIGAPLFALYFAVSNPSRRAIDLASRMAGDILHSLAAFPPGE